MPNLQKQNPYKKTLRAGDVFCLRYGACRYLFGRVIAVNAAFGGFSSGCIRVHIYKKENNSQEVPRGLIESDLLIPPQHINRLGFSRGYMPVVGNIPLGDADSRTDVCYYDAFKSRFVDQSGRVLDRPTKTVGEFGLGNYRTMDDKISQALGLPLSKE